MRRVLHVLGFGAAGFALGAVCAFAAVTFLSSNSHDRSLEAAMTAFFAGGPVGALAGGVLGALRGSRQDR